MGSRLSSGIAWLVCLPLLVYPVAAGAAINLGISQPPATAPFANAITRAIPSWLTVTVRNSGNSPVHLVDFVLPTTSSGPYVANGGTAPAGWTVSTPAPGTIRFESACSTTGITPATPATFVLAMTGPATMTGADSNSSDIAVNATTDPAGSNCPGARRNGSITFTAPVKSLYLFGATATPTSSLNTQVVTWTVANQSGAAQTNVTVTPVIVNPSGPTGTCTTVPSIPSYGTATITCTYATPGPGNYTFSANAMNGGGNATAVGATASNITWTKPTIAYGRALTLGLTVQNYSQHAIIQVDVTNSNAIGWTLGTGNSGTAGDVVFAGSVASGTGSALGITFSAVPTITETTTYPSFAVTLRPQMGSTYAATASPPQTVTIVVPISDVAGFTIRANSDGNLLTWTNTSIPGSPHAGVVVFAAPSGSTPASPADFTTYAAGSGGVVYTDASASSFNDAPAKNYNYRVCNQDQYHVYSNCSDGFWNNAGWLDSGVFPTGGWVHAVGGDARVRAGFVPGDRIALANNSPSVVVVGLIDGQRSFAPVEIPALPANTTPAAVMQNDMTVIIAADQDGNVMAVDIDPASPSTGLPYWNVALDGEHFTAGASGIIRAGASQYFRENYGMDVVLVGSTTGSVFALDATDAGQELWRLDVGSPVRGLITYDQTTDMFWVPTDAGVLAYSMVGTSSGVPPSVPGVAPSSTPLWTLAGGYGLHCTRTDRNLALACIDTTGHVSVVDKRLGTVLAEYDTILAGVPTALVRVDPTAGTPGLVISTDAGVEVVTLTRLPSWSISSRGTWPAPAGVNRISTPAVYPELGYLVVGGSGAAGGTGLDPGRRLYQIFLADAAPGGESQRVSTQTSELFLGQPVFDTTDGRFLFGTNDGHLWAIPDDFLE